MNDRVGPWVRRFLVEYLLGERNYSLHTQQSRRDTFVLFLPFAAKRCRCALDQLPLSRIRPQLVREFVRHLEHVRHCRPSTINQRVSSLRAWARCIGIQSPEHLEWSSQMLTLHLKKHAPAPMNYLEREEMKALLAAPNQRDQQGFRDYVLLLFLYNTRARASEATRLTVGDLDLVSPAATLHGKGRKNRACPLWKLTADKLRELVGHRPSVQPVFLNRHGQALTRFGIHTLVERYARQAALTLPSLSAKRVSPHTIRHATAMTLLQSGVDINTIRVWLGHVSLQTTHLYAESDLKMKAKALACCEAPLLEEQQRPSCPKGLIGFLKTL